MKSSKLDSEVSTRPKDGEIKSSHTRHSVAIVLY